MIVAGIDTSLTGTGLAIVNAGVVEACWTVSSKGHRGDTLIQRNSRLVLLSSQIVNGLVAAGVELAVIESPAYSKSAGSTHDRSGLWWLIVTELLRGGVEVVEAPPSVRIKYATGKGNKGKDEVMLAASKTYAVDLRNNNEADAVLLSAIAARLVGEPVEAFLPKEHLVAMRSVTRSGDNTR